MTTQAIDIEVLGRTFTVSCGEHEQEGLLQAVAHLDAKMREIRDAGKTIAFERIAMMAALNIAHEFLSSQTEAGSMGNLKKHIANIEQQIDQSIAIKKIATS